jgi:hypothetical protein
MSLDLSELADDLLDTHDGAVGSLLVCVELHRPSGEPVVRVRPLDGHPAAVLDGFRAPSSCLVLGVVAGAWGAPMDGIRPSAHPEAQRVTTVVLLGRDGAIESRIRWPDGSTLCDAPRTGLVLDAMRAALGLPLAS